MFTDFSSIVWVLLTIMVIVVLIQKELLSGLGSARARIQRRVLNIVALPLLGVFIASSMVHLSRASEQYITIPAQLSARLETSAAPSPAAVAEAAAPSPAAAVETAAPSPRPSAAPVVAPAATAQPSAASAAAKASVPPSPTTQPPLAPRTPPLVDENFESVASGWPVRPMDGWSASFEDGRYAVRVLGEQPIGIAYPAAGGDYRLAVDLAVQQGAAGLVFLYTAPGSFVWAGLDAQGQFGVERIDGEAVSMLVPWQPIAGAGAAGETKRLEVQRRGGTISISTDGRQLATLQTPDGSWDNRYGFVVAPRGGGGAAVFDNLLGERLGVGESRIENLELRSRYTGAT